MNASEVRRPRRPFNPFYLLLMMVGTAFCLTACAFGVMTVRGLQPLAGAAESASSQLFMHWLDQYGFRLMLIELGILGLCTVGAMTTDTYWSRA